MRESLCAASPRALTLTAALRVRARGERECRSIWGSRTMCTSRAAAAAVAAVSGGEGVGGREGGGGLR